MRSVLCPQFVNTLTQLPVSLEFLPVGKSGVCRSRAGTRGRTCGRHRESLLEPGPEASRVIPLALYEYLHLSGLVMPRPASRAPEWCR
jgi:hypothetical protein